LVVAFDDDRGVRGAFGEVDADIVPDPSFDGACCCCLGESGAGMVEKDGERCRIC